MRASIVRIGNSNGIRIPKMLLQESGLAGVVEIKSTRDGLIIRRVSTPRDGWEAAFQRMAQAGDDHLVDGAVLPATGWDHDEWEW